MRLKGLLRKLDGTGLSLPGEDELEFMLWHDNALYGVFRAKPNPVGTVVFEAPLPENAALGAYQLTIGHEGERYSVFRVDRGERPLLEVTVKPDAEIVFAGATVHSRVQVMRLGNVAAIGVPVTVKVYRGAAPAAPRPEDPREDFFNAVALQNYPDSDRQDTFAQRLAAMNEVWNAQGVTDAKGEYSFSFDSDKREAARYLIFAEAKALPGRSEAATAEVLSHDLPLFLEVAPERFSYYPGETLRAKVTTRALDGKALSASLRLEVGREDGTTGRRSEYFEIIKTDKDGQAQIAVALGKSQGSIRLGLQGAAGWVYRDVMYTLNQIGASSGEKGLRLQLDRKAYYPGETAHVTIQSDRPGLDVLLTVSREKVRAHHRFAINGTIGVFDLPVDELGAPNLFFHAAAVANDSVYSAAVEIPVVPTHQFLKVEVETEKETYAGGTPVAAVVKVSDWKGKPVPDAEVSLAAVLSSAFVLQEDLTPDLARYFLNHRLPHWVTFGGSELAKDAPRDDSFWLAAVFAWGVYNDLAGIGVDDGPGHGSFGFRNGGGRRLMVKRHGGSRSSEGMYDAYSEFLRQHGLTLFHEARLVTDKDGRAKVEFLLPAGNGEFRFTARALTAGTLIGEIRRTVKFHQDVALQAPWPASIREGERFETPLFVVNNSEKAQRGTVAVAADLPVKLLAAPEVTIPAGGVARLDFELDARQLPQSLSEPQSGYQPPLLYAKFSATFAHADGPKITSEAMVPVFCKGIPVERRTVALVAAGRGGGAKEVRFNLQAALPASVRLQIRPLADPKEIVRWLLEDLKQHEGGDYYAWAAESIAARLPAGEIEAGKFLPIEAPLMAALSHGVGFHGGGREPYFLAVSSALRRGVRLPAGWAEDTSKASGTAVENLKPFEAWALAECQDTPEEQSDLAAGLDKLRLAGNWPREDWAFLALGLHKLDRKSKAARCLDNALAGVQLHRREHARELPLRESAALLLAGVRVGLDNETLGVLYEAVLDSLAHTPRPEPQAAALAAHGVMAWSELWQAAPEPLKLTLNGKEKALQPAGLLEEFPDANQNVSIAIAPPKSGAAAAEIVCSYRLPGEEPRVKENIALSRSFIRLDKDGVGQWLQAGEALRLGDTLLMLLEAAAEDKILASVPPAGPWEGMPLQRYQTPAIRVRREFILSTEKREKVLAAVEEKRLEDARTEMLAAIAAGDYLEETEGGAEQEIPALPAAITDTQAGCVRFEIRKDRHLIVLAYKPDRTGDFLAPAAWLNTAEDNLPVVSTAPFALRVLEAAAELPARPVELHVREELRDCVTAALKLVPGSFLNSYVDAQKTSVDVRALAFFGLLHSTAPQAADAYAALRWPDYGADAFEVLREAIQWRNTLKDANLSADQPFGSGVLKRALESDELAARLARAMKAAGLEPFKTSQEQGQAAGALIRKVSWQLMVENIWRCGLNAAARGTPALEGIGNRVLTLADVLQKVEPDEMARLLQDLELAVDSERRLVRGPTLKEALKTWAEENGLTIAMAEDVPDLQAEEFVLALPTLPSVKSLDESLRGLYLRAHREGRTVNISLDRDWARFKPEVRDFLTAKDAAGRLRAFLEHFHANGAQLKQLAAPQLQETAYTPRVEFPVDLAASDFLEKLRLDAERPLAEQLFTLRAQGVRLETAEGILRLSLVKQP